jgi:hypothetical protein
VRTKRIVERARDERRDAAIDSVVSSARELCETNTRGAGRDGERRRARRYNTVALGRRTIASASFATVRHVLPRISLALELVAE